jgi:hypothetical protein
MPARKILLTYNCTSFARAFFQEGSLAGAPGAGFLGLGENPNRLAQGIQKRNPKKDQQN